MSAFAMPDVLGPLEVIGPGMAEAIPLRKRMRVRGGVTVQDDPGAMRSRMRFPDYAFGAVTIDQSMLAQSSTPWAQSVSGADLIRVDNQVQDGLLEGLADAVSLGSYYYAVRAVPNKPAKVLVNVGTQSLRVQPPAAALPDPNTAGIFLDTIYLVPGMAVRIVWDGQSFGYRIKQGQRTYVTYAGQYVVYQGQRIYYRG